MVDRLVNFSGEVKKILNPIVDGLVVGTGRKLYLEDVVVDNPDKSLKAELKSKLAGQTHGTAVKGKFRLEDENTGKVERNTKRLFKLPIQTSRGTYIWNGNEIVIKNQYRRKPGVYVAQDSTGTYQAAFNMATGSAKFSQKVGVSIDPESGKITFKVRDSKFSLYALMKAFNVPEVDIKEALGKRLYTINVLPSYEDEVKKITKRLVGKSHETYDEAAEDLREAFSNVSFAGGSNELTLGVNHTNITPMFWVDVAKKLRNTAEGVTEPDDLDASYFREYLEPEDNILEAIKSSGSKFATRVRRRGSKKDLPGILADSRFEKPVYDLFANSSLKDYKDQTNPMDWAMGSDALTVFGPGGISQSRSIKDSMRGLQPTLFGLADPITTPESSEKVGVVLHRSVGSSIKNREPHIQVKTKDGKSKTISTLTFKNSVVSMSESSARGMVDGFKNGQAVKIKSSEAEYFVKPENLFSYVTNMVPMLGSTYGVRANVGAKQLGQALPLKHREAPLVQTEFSKKITNKVRDKFNLDHQGNVIATSDGKVTSISRGVITISSGSTTYKYEYPINFPLNSESFLDTTPEVEVGDTVKKGQIIASSIFSKEGDLAIGTNLKTGMLAYKGYNFEDGFVISESAAKKMTSLHMHKYEIQKSSDITVNKSAYVSIFPSIVTKIKLENYNDDGTIKKGTRVEKGMPLILAFEKRELTPSQAALSSLNKKVAALLAPRDISQIYEEEFPGIVTTAYQDNKNVKVHVKTEEPAIEGDKIATRYGGKGIITKILDDKEMPQNEKGEILDVLFNPHGIPSRMNPSQIIESSLGKIAKIKGKPYILPQFMEEGYVTYAKKELEKAGISDEEVVTDPETGRKLDRVHVGDMYFTKLKQSVRTKIKSGETGFYDSKYEQPKKTSTNGTRAIDGLSFYSLISAGARQNLADMSSIKSTRNDEFWRAVSQGLPLPSPAIPKTRENLYAIFKGLGLNVDVNKKSDIALTPATDNDIISQSNGKIENAKFFRSRDLKPEVGGFYDPGITGGEAGEKWSHIELSERIPNPTLEAAIVKILGLTKDKFYKILDGTIKVTAKGEISEEGTLYGGDAIAIMLDSIDIKSEISNMRGLAKELAEGKKWPELNSVNLKLRYLNNIKRLGKKPSELYTFKNVPVLPPKFRPITILSDGNVQNPPINELYQSLKLESDGIARLKEDGLDIPEIMQKKSLDLYRHTSAIMGTADPVSLQLRTRGADQGLLTQLATKKGGAKHGFLQKRLLRKPQDLSGGTTITVDPTLPIDHVGLPEEIGFKVMKPFITRKLVSIGYSPLDALKAIKDREPIAKAKLDEVLEERPVLINRHPSLHKFNFMSQWASSTPGKSLKLNPLVVHGLNADFDGDSLLGKIWVSTEDSFTRECGDCLTSTSLATEIDISEFPRLDLEKTSGFKEIYSVPKGIKVPSVTDTGEVLFKEVTQFHIHPNCEQWEITYNTGETALVSGGHSLMCFDPIENKIVKTAPAKALGQFVPKIGKYDLPGKKIKGVPSVNYTNFVHALGYALGSVRLNLKTYTPVFSNGEADGVMFKDFDAEGISKISLLQWISSYGISDESICIPSFVLEASLEDRKILAAGLIESLAHVKGAKRHGVYLRLTVSTSHLNDIQNLLSTVGLKSCIRDEGSRKVLEISSLDISQFYFEKPERFSIYGRKRLERLVYSERNRLDRIVPVPLVDSIILWDLVQTTANKIENVRRQVYKTQSYKDGILRGVERWPLSLVQATLSGMSEEEKDLLSEGLKVSLREDISWGYITSVINTGKKVTMYDLTVKDTKTFVGPGGYFYWDTMNVHVPVSEGARIEAATKLLPSASLFGANRDILPMPSNEALLGLYILSKPGKKKAKTYSSLSDAHKDFLGNEIDIDTVVSIGGQSLSVGQALLRKTVPEKYHSFIKSKIVNKGVIQDLIKAVYKENSKLAGELLSSLKDLGNEYAYLSGFSISLKDIEAPSTVDKDVKAIHSLYGKDSKYSENFSNEIDKLKGKYSKFLDGNRMYDMARSGAKGNWGNMSQMLLTPGYMEGAPETGIQDAALTSSYAEGMTPSDYLNTLYASRSGIVAKTRGVATGGELSKDEVHSAMELVVTEKDCGTSNGVSMDRTDKFIIGRVLVGSSVRIDDQYLKTHKKKSFVVRSPSTCEASKGICALCYGLNDQFKSPKVGDHIGVEAAQVTSERITQGLLRAFHSGKGAAAGGSMSLSSHVSNLFGKIPGTFAQEAPLAEETGNVSKIEKSPGGGWSIFVDDKKYHSSDKVEPIVSEGDSVSPGQALTTGMKHPRKVLEVEGLLGVRKYLTHSMRDLYQSTGVDINPVHFEVLGRALTEHGRILEPGSSNYEIGDIELISVLDSLNKSGKSIQYTPVLKGANTIPVLRKDFLSTAIRREARQVIPKAAATGGVSSSRTINPINSWLLGDFRNAPGPQGEF